MRNNNIDSCGVSGSARRSGHRIVMKVDALLPKERAYLLGLFLADGYMTGVKYSARVYFSLARNESELAKRVCGLLRRLGFHPNLKVYSGDRNCIDVRVYGVDLLSYFPEKEKLLTLDVRGLEKWLRSERLLGELGVPFLGGLVDGDGYVSAEYGRGSIFPGVEVCWSFAQKELGFLIDFIVRYVKKLVRHGVGVYVRKGDKGRIVTFGTSGRDALLRVGLARWSWKVSRCSAKAEKMKLQVAYLRSRFLTTPQVARKMNVSRSTVLLWCKRDSIRSVRIRGNRYGAGDRFRFIIPIEEVERVEAKKLAEVDRVRKVLPAGGDSLSVKEASDILQVSRERVWQLCKNGKLAFVSVRTVGGKKKSLIPVEEVERLKRELERSSESQLSKTPAITR